MISIIVPVYRSEETLVRCVESLQKQSYAEIEILLVIDGSPDGSGRLAETLAQKDGRIRVIFQENKGVSAARNRGLEEAKGDYVLFVDSDDYVDGMLCEELWLAIAENNADLAVCGFHHLYFGEDVVKTPKAGTFLVREEKEAFLELYRKQFLNMPWNKLYRREMIHGRFRTDMDLGEDLLFNMEYLSGCRIVVQVEKPLVFYVQDGRGTTLSTRKRCDRMKNAGYLYEQMCEKCEMIYGSADSGGVLETRLAEELLDEAEGLAFAEETGFWKKRNILKMYVQNFRQLLQRNDINVSLLDYRILLFCMRRKWLVLTLCLVEARGLLVKLLRRMRGWKI